MARAEGDISHWLPDIDIATACEPAAFLLQMADLGRASKRFVVEHHYDALGIVGFDAVNFRLQDVSAHQDLSFQLLAWPDNPGRVAVEIRAGRWNPDPPTRTVYCEAARDMVGSLLTALNKIKLTRYRLRIQRPEAGRFKISPRTLALLDTFALLANTSSLHPLDWRRFYRIVHDGRQEVPEEEMRRLLIQRGFPREAALRLADLYVHLWAFKRIR